MIETRFKKTEIGEIPEDWEVYNLGDYVDEIAEGPFGSKLKREHYTSEKEVRIIQLGNIGENGWNNENVKYTTFDHAKEISKCIVRPNEIVIAKMMPAGRAIICPQNEKMYILSSDAVRLKPKENIDTNYLFRAINSVYYRRQIQDKTQGSTRVRTNIAKLIESLIILPESLPEQQRIATFLSDIDTLLSALNKKIEKKKLIKQEVMRQLLTGEKRLAGFTEPWVEKELGNICEIKDGTHQTPKYESSGIPFYSVETVTNNDFKHVKYISIKEHLQLTQKYRINKGDVLMTRIGSIGNCKYIDWDVCASFYVSLALLKFESDSLARYFVHYSTTKDFQTEIDNHSLQFATPKKINLGNISFIKVKYPSSKAEQTAIATILSDMDKEIEELEAKRAKYEQIKQGMMQQLLTGKIRLVSEV